MPIPKSKNELGSEPDPTEQLLRDLDDAELLEMIVEGEEDRRNGRTISPDR
jgi:hypothetical protein